MTPQALTRAPGHPFPLIPNLQLSLAAVVRDAGAGPIHFAYLKVPDAAPRFVALPDGETFVPVEDVIRANLDRKSTRLNSSHLVISYAVFCLKKKKKYRQSYTVKEQIKNTKHSKENTT